MTDTDAVMMKFLGWHGPSTFFRLPVVPPRADSELDIGVVGVPFAGGNPLARTAFLAPRACREASMFMNRTHRQFGFNPFEVCRAADLGDVPVPNFLNNEKTVADIESFFRLVHQAGIRPFSFGGDHTIPAPILRAIAGPDSGRSGPVGLIHMDAHTDSLGEALGAKDNCACFVRSLVDEGIVDPRRTIQIGLNGHLGSLAQEDWTKAVGIRSITQDEFLAIGIAGTTAEIQRVVGPGPAYFTFDIDCLEPVYVPATGVPEIGGFTPREALALIRGCRGLDIIGGDVVCFHPAIGDTRLTAWYTTSFAFEIICLLADARSREQKG